ncbi:unnamed protein product [Didymodactylos carnosus]|uniref:Uncharacterized protein n=1 Tax=Didymodactylos carnosus TaxID=1234261 RepID=A0A8S2DZE3_9BILA|nr:unnamed protein product [Didymodactylos carnosus]CAF3855823.1 unnamed protein product [Didymodactylos carnosus]
MEPRLDRTDERGGEVVLALRDTVRYHEVMNRTHQNNEIPKTVVPSPTATQNEKSEPVDSLSSSSSTAVRNTSKPKETPTVIEDPFDNFLCKSCNRGDDDAYLLICDRCDNSITRSGITLGRWINSTCAVLLRVAVLLLLLLLLLLTVHSKQH